MNMNTSPGALKPMHAEVTSDFYYHVKLDHTQWSRSKQTMRVSYFASMIFIWLGFAVQSHVHAQDSEFERREDLVAQHHIPDANFSHVRQGAKGLELILKIDRHPSKFRDVTCTSYTGPPPRTRKSTVWRGQCDFTLSDGLSELIEFCSITGFSLPKTTSPFDGVTYGKYNSQKYFTFNLQLGTYAPKPSEDTDSLTINYHCLLKVPWDS